jgi:hypothetical protein
VVQASDLDAREYQTNVELGRVIRANLAYLGRPKVDARVDTVVAESDGFRLFSAAGSLRAYRVILATGLGRDRIPFPCQTERAMSFSEFVKFVGGETLFPLRDLGRVAVIGAGDSGKVVMEYLMGQGPEYRQASATFDTVERVDWFGQPSKYCEDFVAANRSRYAGLARFLPSRDYERYYRIYASPKKVVSLKDMGERMEIIATGDDGSSYRGIYDTVIICCGFEEESLNLPPRAFERHEVDGVPVARKMDGLEIYKIGPCSNLPIDYREKRENRLVDRVPENSAALFRYAGKIQSLARSLP